MFHFSKTLVCAAVTIGWAASSSSSVHAQASLTKLEPLPPPSAIPQVVAKGVSGDGSTAVGVSSSVGSQAFRWTQSTGMVAMGYFPDGGAYSNAYGVNHDGSVIVGVAQYPPEQQAFRWTQATGMVNLGDLPGGSSLSEARGVNADGSVVVGFGNSASGGEAFRWTQATGMVGLGDLPGGSFQSLAWGTDANGSVVVGTGQTNFGSQAFRWTAGTMTGLGDLPGGNISSEGFATNADGSVVVGTSSSTNGPQAFRWTQAAGMVGLGDFPGSGSLNGAALGVSADGSVVVGTETSALGGDAFIWTQATGMRRLWDVLLEKGLNPADHGWTKFDKAMAVSADGNIIVGYGTPTGLSSLDFRGFVAVIPEPASATLSAFALAGLALRRRPAHTGRNRKM